MYIALALAYASGLSLRNNRPAIIASGLALSIGAGLTLYGSTTFALYILGQVLVGFGNPILLVAWADYLACASRDLRSRRLITAALISALLVLIFKLLSGNLARIFFLSLTIGTWCLLLPKASKTQDKNLGVPPKTRCSSLRSALISSLTWELVLLMACYALLYRIMKDFGYEAPIITPTVRAISSIVAMASLGIYLAHSRKASNRNAPVLWLFMLTAGALLLIPAGNGFLGIVASAIASSCWPLFYYLLWMILLDAGDHNSAGPVVTFVMGWSTLNIVLIFVAPVAYMLTEQVGHGTLSAVALVLVLAYTLLVASLLMRRRVGNDKEEIDRPPSLDEQCFKLGKTAGLTQRELDVLTLLARGRSVPFIAQELGISSSTVKGHVKHIYAKTGAEGRQNLLSMLEVSEK
jgi:DNA-binding CsgD family transcriptional regulator